MYRNSRFKREYKNIKNAEIIITMTKLDGDLFKRCS